VPLDERVQDEGEVVHHPEGPFVAAAALPLSTAWTLPRPRRALGYMASTLGMISSLSRLRSSSVLATGTSANGGQRSGIVSPASL
jgi:hypothetical protein